MNKHLTYKNKALRELNWFIKVLECGIKEQPHKEEHLANMKSIINDVYCGNINKKTINELTNTFEFIIKNNYIDDYLTSKFLTTRKLIEVVYSLKWEKDILDYIKEQEND